MKKILPDRVYDILKWVAITAIPAFVVFFSTILPVLDVSPETVNKVTTILGAFGLLIAMLLGVASYTYEKSKTEQ